MSITGSSNSALARSVALDASYISRLRCGKRRLPKDGRILQGMAAYFARNCTQAYQKKALSDLLKYTVSDSAALADAIFRWLTLEGDAPAQRVELFLGGLSNMPGRPAPPCAPVQARISAPRGISVHYGIEGKRRAVEYFLSEVAAQEKPQTLLLYSDEETSWMTGDLAFVQRWAALMTQVLSRGNRIKIIHTISRDLDEMLSAISQWMPLYMSGAIEPYFYPKKRDGVFKRTLFIAPATAAVVSSSINETSQSAANLLLRDGDAVASYAAEFLQYLRLCRPLMRIFTSHDEQAFLTTLAEFEQEQADTLIKTESISLLTMPEPVLSKILGRLNVERGRIREIYRTRSENLRRTLEMHRVTEIVTLHDAQSVQLGKVKVGMSDMIGGGAYYTPEEYMLHLEHLVTLLKTCPHFYAHVVKGPQDAPYIVYAREELGAIIAKTSQPPVVLAINESNMTAAFWDYLKSLVGEKAFANPDNRAAAALLQEHLETLRNAPGVR